MIITGETRTEALERSRRALDEMVVDGMATALPFHRLIVRDPSFIEEPFRVHTRWIETEWDNTVPPLTGRRRRGQRRRGADHRRGRGRRQTARGLAAGLHGYGRGWPASPHGQAGGAKRQPAGHASAVSGDALASPMQGTIVKVAVAEGDTVAEGDLSSCLRR